MCFGASEWPVEAECETGGAERGWNRQVQGSETDRGPDRPAGQKLAIPDHSEKDTERCSRGRLIRYQ